MGQDSEILLRLIGGTMSRLCESHRPAAEAGQLCWAVNALIKKPRLVLTNRCPCGDS